MNQPGRFLFVGAIFITAIVVHALPVPAQEPQHFSAKADPQSNSSEAMHPGKPLIPIRAQSGHWAAARESRQPSLLYRRLRKGNLPHRLAYMVEPDGPRHAAPASGTV